MYLEREVLPYVPDAWVDHDKTKIGYEIPFTREFYVYEAATTSVWKRLIQTMRGS